MQEEGSELVFHIAACWVNCVPPDSLASARVPLAPARMGTEACRVEPDQGPVRPWEPGPCHALALAGNPAGV